MTTAKERKQRWVIAGIAIVVGITFGVIGANITGRHGLIPRPEMEVYPLDRAAGVMSDYVRHLDLGSSAKNKGLGGEFPVSLFSKVLNCSGDSCGISLWFCQDTTGVFLALEDSVRIYSYKDMPSGPTASTLYRPSSIFRFPEGHSDNFSAVRRYLRDDRRATTKPKTMTKREVNAAIAKFRSTFGGYNKFNFSFVGEDSNHYFKAFLDKAGTDGYVRYYFAFEDRHISSDREMPNKIRIIFVAADSTGDNLITSTKSMDDPILQSSWPPPPY